MTEVLGSGVGAELAQAREALGLALTDVAHQLKFAPRQLEALEQERFDLLPGSTFARGMVRAYARLLKIDADPLLERIADRFASPDSSELAARFRQPVPFSDSSRRSTIVYLVVSVLILGVVGGIAYEWQGERTAVATLPSGSPAAVAPVEAPRAPPIPVQPAVAVAAPPPLELPEVKTAPKELVIAAPRPASGLARIVLRCDEEAWLEVYDAAGRNLISSLNAAGTERAVHGRPPFTVVIGNAPHVQLTYNDRSVDLAPYTRVQVARFTLK